jgi:hypothetical protein
MMERPILFSAPMVRAILDGRKTETRRVMIPQPDASLNRYRREIDRFRCVGRDVKTGKLSFEAGNFAGPINAFRDGRDSVKADISCPFGRPGDRLWVRETWCPVDDREHGGEKWIDYRATPKYSAEHPAGWEAAPEDAEALKWRPSIHMPRWASRIMLEVEDVRPEMLDDMGETDAMFEGVEPLIDATQEDPWAQTDYLGAYRLLWDSRNTKRGYGWDSNPWVWVIEFRLLPDSARAVA